VASLPASDPASDPLPCAPSTINQPKQATVAANAEGAGLQFLAHICVEGDRPDTGCADAGCQQPAGERALILSLLGTAQLLYQQAERHEEETEYNLADRLRSLARDLRDEAISIDRRSPNSPPPPPVSAPAATTAPASTPWQSPDSAPAEKLLPTEEPRTVTVGPPPLG
jgi:hypothetical protein